MIIIPIEPHVYLPNHANLSKPYHTTSALISQTPQMIPPVEAKPGQQMIKPAPKALPTVATTVANTT